MGLGLKMVYASKVVSSFFSLFFFYSSLFSHFNHIGIKNQFENLFKSEVTIEESSAVSYDPRKGIASSVLASYFIFVYPLCSPLLPFQSQVVTNEHTLSTFLFPSFK